MWYKGVLNTCVWCNGNPKYLVHLCGIKDILKKCGGCAGVRRRSVHQRVHRRRPGYGAERADAGPSGERREEHKRNRYPPEKNPYAEFVVEARGRLGSEVLSFLRQHAPEKEPLRSAVLTRATREISIITQRGLAALLLSAEPRPAVV